MELLKYAGQPQAVVVLNGVPPRGTRKEQAEHVVRDMTIPVAAISLGHRTAFPDAAALGLTAQEYDRSGKAAGEIQQLHKFVCKLVNSLTPKQDDTDAAETRLATSNQ